MIDWSHPKFNSDKPPYLPGERVFMSRDGHFGIIRFCFRAPGTLQWCAEMIVDGKRIGPRLCRELEEVKLRMVK